MNRQSSKIVLAVLAGLIVFVGCDGGGPEVGYVDAFVGHWMNEDPNTFGITAVQIRATENALYVRMWGDCSPTDCDWGETTTPLSDANDPQLNIFWDHGFATRTQTIDLLDNGRLRVESFADYVDERPDATRVYLFTKT